MGMNYNVRGVMWDPCRKIYCSNTCQPTTFLAHDSAVHLYHPWVVCIYSLYTYIEEFSIHFHSTGLRILDEYRSILTKTPISLLCAVRSYQGYKWPAHKPNLFLW